MSEEEICRHSPGDPNCGSYERSAAASDREELRETKARLARVQAEKAKMSETPDSERYEIDRAQRLGNFLVIQATYPNCAKCSYEGKKIMVFADIGELDVMRWRKIDPHFRQPGPAVPREAPSPIARFPANDEGWEDAVEYASRKLRKKQSG